VWGEGGGERREVGGNGRWDAEMVTKQKSEAADVARKNSIPAQDTHATLPGTAADKGQGWCVSESVWVSGWEGEEGSQTAAAVP
jgi:hypothetical protein